MNFEIIGEITEIDIIAIGSKIHDIARLRRMYGKGRWRKLKGRATVRLRSGRIRLAPVTLVRGAWYRSKRDEA